MRWDARTPRPAHHRGRGIYSARPLDACEVELASTVAGWLGLDTLIVF